MVKIVEFAPEKDAPAVRSALGQAGAGKLGNYTFCSFSIKGIGRFKAGDDTNPHVGKPGTWQEVSEERIEVACTKQQAPEIIKVIKEIHPYEEVVIDIYPMLALE